MARSKSKIFNKNALRADVYLGFFDFVFKFERIRAGILWEVGFNLLLPFVISLLWVKSTNKSLQEMYVYVLIGFVVWNMWQNCLLSSTGLLFRQFQSNILNNPTSCVHYSIRMVLTNSLVSFVIFCMCVLVTLLTGEYLLTFNWLLIIPTFVVSMLCLIPVCYVVSVLCARLRDLEKVLNLALGLSILMTPVFWTPEFLGRYADFVFLNPIAAHIVLVRSLILADGPILLPLISLAGWAIVSSLISAYLVKTSEQSVRFWIQ